MSSVSYLTSEKNVQVPNSQEQLLFRFLVVEKGEGNCKIGCHVLHTIPGDLILVMPNESCDLAGLKSASTWVVSFDADILMSAQIDAKEFLMLLGGIPLLSFWVPKTGKTEHFQRHFRINSADWSRWLIRLQQLEKELREQPLGHVEAVQSLLKLLFFDIVRLAEPHLKQNSLRCCPLLKQVFHFIAENYSNSIGLCDVAKAVDRSPAYLTDFVRRETGRTVLNWIVEYRMANARQLLLQTNQTIDQIAESVGYFDRRHFSRQFLRLHDATPRSWRQAHRTGVYQGQTQKEVIQSSSENFSYGYSFPVLAGA